MVEDGFDVRLPCADETWKRTDTNHAALRGNRAYQFVGEVTLAVVHTARVGMSHNHRRVTRLDCLHAGLPADMGKVDDHAELVHTGHYGTAVFRQSAIRTLKTAVAESITEVVG